TALRRVIAATRIFLHRAQVSCSHWYCPFLVITTGPSARHGVLKRFVVTPHRTEIRDRLKLVVQPKVFTPWSWIGFDAIKPPGNCTHTVMRDHIPLVGEHDMACCNTLVAQSLNHIGQRRSADRPVAPRVSQDQHGDLAGVAMGYMQRVRRGRLDAETPPARGAE